MRQISPKQSARLGEYRKIRELLYRLNEEENGGRSEYSGKLATYSPALDGYTLEDHHVHGRIGRRLCDPFNQILLTSEEHRAAENNEITKEELRDKVRPIRIKQGFKEIT